MVTVQAQRSHPGCDLWPVGLFAARRCVSRVDQRIWDRAEGGLRFGLVPAIYRDLRPPRGGAVMMLVGAGAI